MKNYYQILGVPFGATQQQIKAAYKERVKQLHPDYYGKDSEPFHELQEAYAVLGDPERRRKYDSRIDPQIRKAPPEGRPPIEEVSPRRESGIIEIYPDDQRSANRPPIEEVFFANRRDLFDNLN